MNLTIKEINALIKTGFQANCEKIEYNGLIITYKHEQSAVVQNYNLVNETPTLTPPVAEQASLEMTDDDLMYVNPLAYEEKMAFEELDGKVFG